MPVRFPRLALFGACIVIGTLSTHADQMPACPENASQTAAQIIQHFRTATPIDEQYINVANGLAQACNHDYITTLTLAEAWASLSLRDGIELEQRYQIAERAMGLLVHVQSLPFVEHNYEVAGQTREKVIYQLVAIADAGGPIIDWLNGTVPFPVCERGFSNPAQTLWYKYRDDQASAHTPALLEAQAKACTNGKTKDALGYFAAYKTGLAESTDDPERAFELLKDARDLYDNMGGESQSAVGWSPDQRDVFDRKFIRAGLQVIRADEVMPKADLFKPENMKLNRSKLDLQYYIDQSWPVVARDEDGKLLRDEMTERMRAHLYLTQELGALARAESKNAEWYLFRALKDHREHGLRKPANENAGTPPDFILETYNPNKTSD